MSKERELLKRWFNDIGIIQADIKLLRDTQELLAQPEQENVFQKLLRTEDGVDVEILLSELCQDGYVARLTAENTMLIEKRSTSKREPLSDGITADMYRANNKATHPDSYWAGVYDAEKEHGIGGK